MNTIGIVFGFVAVAALIVGGVVYFRGSARRKRLKLFKTQFATATRVYEELTPFVFKAVGSRMKVKKTIISAMTFSTVWVEYRRSNIAIFTISMFGANGGKKPIRVEYRTGEKPEHLEYSIDPQSVELALQEFRRRFYNFTVDMPR